MYQAVIIMAILATAAAIPNLKTGDEAFLEGLHEQQAFESSSDVPLDKNSFFIYNKVYSRAKLSVRRGKKSIITYEGLMSPNQIWILEKSKTHPGYYYINSAQYPGYRLAISSSMKRPFRYNGHYYKDQLWKFEKVGEYYRIYNKQFPRRKLAKYGKANYKIEAYRGRNYEDQLWKLVPRFSATAREHIIWSIDNRHGSNPVTKSFKIITGLKLTRSKTVSIKVGFEKSLTASVGAAGLGSAGFSTKFFAEIHTSLLTESESSWSKETTTEFTAPAGKHYIVYQTVLDFSSPYKKDDCSLYTHERITENGLLIN